MAPMLGLVIVLASLIPHSIATPSLEECRARFVVKPASVADPDRQFDGKFSQQDAPQQAASISASVNGFGFNLLKILQGVDGGMKANKNVVASPLGISVAFSFLYDGATPGSETKAEIAAALGFESDTCYGVLMRSSLDGLSTDVSNGNELALASKVYVDDDVEVAPTFINSDDIEAVDFSDPRTASTKINQFVSQATRGQIKRILQPSSLDPATTMTVVNALFFKGQWAEKFDKSKTAKGIFTRADGSQKEVAFMDQEAEFLFSRSDSPVGTFLELPYLGGRFAMQLFLPKDIEGADQFLSALSFEYWRSIVQKARKTEVVVKLPKFDIEASYSLHKTLPLLSPGMRKIFTIAAELSLLLPKGGFVESALHKARMKINEEGTEAAAATVASVQPLSAPPTFIADRPFFYFITDKQNGGLVMFMGSVMNP